MTGNRGLVATRRGTAPRGNMRFGFSRRTVWAAVGAGLCFAVGATLIQPPKPGLIWNVSASAPLGLYRVEQERALAIGDMVAARVPQHWRRFAGARGYIPVDVPLIKRIAAADGDRVCAQGTSIFVNGVRIAARLGRDGAGRSMPGWSGCVSLDEKQYLLLMPGATSFDGRYFGLTPSADILGKAELLWAR